MGSRMAMNLHSAGHQLKVFNRSRGKTKPFADKGIQVCESPAAAVQGAEFVCSIVSDDVATREVMLGASGIVSAAAAGTIILDSSTNTPAMSREVAKAAQAAEAAGLDLDATMEVLGEGAAGSRVLRTKLQKMLKRDFAPQFQLELMDKDLRYFLALAQELDRPAPLASLVRSQFQAARRAQLGKLDSCAVFLQAAGEKPKG